MRKKKSTKSKPKVKSKSKKIKLLSDDAVEIFKILSFIIAAIGLLFGIYKFYYVQVEKPEIDEANQIKKAYIALNIEIQRLNSYCLMNRELSMSNKIKIGYNKKLESYRNKLKRLRFNLEEKSANIYENFNIEAHNKLACYIRWNIKRTEQDDLCAGNFPSNNDLDFWARNFFDTLKKPKYENNESSNISHAEKDRNIDCSKEIPFN